MATTKQSPTDSKTAAKKSSTSRTTTRKKSAMKPRTGQKRVDGKTSSRSATRAPAVAPDAPPARKAGGSDGELVVFAFRLTRAERDLIHERAGSAKASRFVRGVALAAARGDETAFREVLAANTTAS